MSILIVVLLLAVVLVKGCELCNLSMCELITHYGFPCETHSVTCADGFVLTLFRIPKPKASPVLLQHGLLDSSMTWILNGPEESLGFLLADMHDVWFGNNRGNTFSRPNCSSSKCWEFTFDEMALYDMPGDIDYILNATGYSSLSYVGHSQGTTQAFAAFSQDSDLQKKVNLFVGLAPVAFLAYQKSVVLSILRDLGADMLFFLFGINDFLPSTEYTKWLAEHLCVGDTAPVCEDLVFAIAGENPVKSHNLNQTRLPLLTSHTPAGTSTMNMVHWGQVGRSGKFQKYDYGSSENLVRYNSSIPPLYNLSNINLKMALFTGGQDDLADTRDYQTLVASMPYADIVYTNFQPDYAHLDFTWGVNAHRVIYPQVMSLITKYAVQPSV